MINKSIWTKFYDKNNNFKALDNDYNLDIAIIGGGITGISIAYFLMNSNNNIGLFDRGHLVHGITSKTTGKVTFLQQGILTKIANIYNKKIAKKYYKSQKEAIELIKYIISTNKIDCDFKLSNSYYFATNKKDILKIKQEKELLESFGEDIVEVNSLPDKSNIKYGIMCQNTYVFNPIKYLNSLINIIKDKIKIYENSKVTSIKKTNNGYLLSINGYKVKAKKVLIASHYPYFLLPYLMPLKCSLEKSLIGAYKDLSNNEFNAISNSNPIISVRYVEDASNRYKILLTGFHNLSLCKNDKKDIEILKRKNIDYLWSNTDIITKDHLPYIGSIDKNLYIATGYNTWGMTNSILSGKIISDIILNKENTYINLFNPNRVGNLKTFIKYPLYITYNTYSYLNTKIKKKKDWYRSKVTFKNINGENIAIYTDENNKKHIVKNKCPHLGCSLLFNEEELTWDCPCHASRFNLDGKVIEGPSNYDISYNRKNKI